jgi:hypothetical protein
MSEQKENILYKKNTLEFVTVALEYCSFIETASKYNTLSFVDKAIKILPLLYLKATLLPEIDEPEDDDIISLFINEETYDFVKTGIEDLMGEKDMFLDTFHPDMSYSDTPIAAMISENMADIYQDLGDFAALFRQENEAVMLQALYYCSTNFRKYWGQKLLNALRALHVVRFDDNDIDDE